MASPEGALSVRLAWDGRRVQQASIRSTRPLATPRVLAGRTVQDAASMVPLLYSVCAFAQGSAAASALAAARDGAAAPAVVAARSLAVALEALQEDLRRLLVDLPQAIGEAACVEPVTRARKAIAPVLAALRPALAVDAMAAATWPDVPVALVAGLEEVVHLHVLGMPSERFASLAHAPAFEDWARTAGTAAASLVARVLAASPGLGASDVRPMPQASRDAVTLGVLPGLAADDGFARAPTWAGEVVETGALAHCATHPGLASFVAAHGNGVASRLLARLVDLANTLAEFRTAHLRPRVIAWSPRDGEGIAGVRTARGLLVHRARVTQRRVDDYAIIAPTEWNFHPDGALAKGLRGLAAADGASLARDANLVVQTLDPCVECTVVVGHA